MWLFPGVLGDPEVVLRSKVSPRVGTLNPELTIASEIKLDHAAHSILTILVNLKHGEHISNMVGDVMSSCKMPSIFCLPLLSRKF